MDPKEYLAIRKAYNSMRQDKDQDNRLTFEEFAILSILYDKDYLTATEIAEFQKVSRPTMTHRGNHLEKLELITRTPGVNDRRQVCCAITPLCKEYVEKQLKELLTHLPKEIAASFGRGKAASENLRKQIIEMGTQEILAGSLTLFAFGLFSDEQEVTITDIVDSTSLLQPTVSMSVARLERAGLLSRQRGSATSRRTTLVSVTEEGQSELDDMLSTVSDMKVVHSK